MLKSNEKIILANYLAEKSVERIKLTRTVPEKGEFDLFKKEFNYFNKILNEQSEY